MLRVGLTGNVASGKSSVSAVWREAGVRVIDADLLAREAVAPGSQGLDAVRARFGDAVLDADGALDRAALRRTVFAEPAARLDLEAIVHPEVARLRQAEDAAALEAGAPIVVHEVPLLYETGLDREMDVVVLVHAPAETRLARLLEKRGLTEPEARAIMDAQIPSEPKLERADIVIRNDGSRERLERAAADVLLDLRRRAEARP